VLNGGSGNDQFAGAGGNDTIHGGAGNDLIGTGAGNDTLDGGTGADVMVGRLGNDTYYVDNFGDQVVENAGEGQDTIIVLVSGYTLATNVEIGAVGTSTGLTLNANPTQDSILFGNIGDDVLNGGSGNDQFNGNASDDQIYGGAGSDLLGGGAGNDVLVGGTGNDVLVGEAGNDRFVFQFGDGQDSITDFDTTSELIDLRGYGAAGVNNFASLISHVAQVGNDAIITFDANNTLVLQHVQLSQLNQNDFLFS